MNYNIANMFATPLLKFDFADHKDNIKLLELIKTWDTGSHALVSGAQSSYMKSDKQIYNKQLTFIVTKLDWVTTSKLV